MGPVSGQLQSVAVPRSLPQSGRSDNVDSAAVELSLAAATSTDGSKTLLAGMPDNPLRPRLHASGPINFAGDLINSRLLGHSDTTVVMANGLRAAFRHHANLDSRIVCHQFLTRFWWLVWVRLKRPNVHVNQLLKQTFVGSGGRTRNMRSRRSRIKATLEMDCIVIVNSRCVVWTSSQTAVTRYRNIIVVASAFLMSRCALLSELATVRHTRREKQCQDDHAKRDNALHVHTSSHLDSETAASKSEKSVREHAGSSVSDWIYYTTCRLTGQMQPRESRRSPLAAVGRHRA